MPALRARETGLKDQIAALDAQAADRDAYLRLAGDLEGFLARLRGRTRPPPPSRTASASCAPSSRTSSSAPRNSPSATASRSGNHPAAAATTTPPTRRVTCAKVRCCVGGVIAPVCEFIIAGTVCRNPARERHAAPRRHASPPAAPALTTRNQTRRPGDESHTQILVSDHALLNGIGLARVADVLPQHAANRAFRPRFVPGPGYRQELRVGAENLAEGKAPPSAPAAWCLGEAATTRSLGVTIGRARYQLGGVGGRVAEGDGHMRDH